MPVLSSFAGDGLELPVADRAPGQLCPVGLGVLTAEIGPGMVDEVIGRAGCREKRTRLLPARTVVYFVLGLCLFSGADSMGPPGYRSVMRWLTNGLRHLQGVPLPTSSALTRARQRLGARPLELLFGLRRGVLAAAGTPGAFAFGLRLVAWDGTGIDAADTPANAAAFGGAGGGGPQLRLLALIECGTHALIDAVFDGAGRASEHKLARRLLHALGPGMLLLADRNFPGWELWGLAARTGADLAWRIKKNLVFPPVRVLADGSFLSIMPTPAENVRLGQARAAGRIPAGLPEGHLVRIIEYTVTVRAADGTTTIEPFRLVTTLLDHRRAPAAALAALYHQRWESENGYAELKTRLRGAGFILRSRSPELVRQELFAFLTVYQALCALQAEAARQAGIDPDRISFTVTVRVTRDHAASQAIITAPNLALARRQAIADLLSDTLPRRRDRHYQRVRKQPRNNFPVMKRKYERQPSRITYKIEVTPKPWQPAQTP
jgi:transposase IS4-like protein/DDE family transposase